MFLDNALQHVRACRVVPDAVGIDDSDGPGGTNLQAICLGALNPTARPAFGIDPFGPGQFQLVQSALEKLPRGHTFFTRATFLLFAHRTQKDMTVDRFAA